MRASGFSSYKIKLRKMTPHFELLNRRDLRKFFELQTQLRKTLNFNSKSKNKKVLFRFANSKLKNKKFHFELPTRS